MVDGVCYEKGWKRMWIRSVSGRSIINTELIHSIYIAGIGKGYEVRARVVNGNSDNNFNVLYEGTEEGCGTFLNSLHHRLLNEGVA